MKKGEILSEIQFYTVKEVNKNEITVVDDLGNEIDISLDYANLVLNSASNYDKVEKLSATALAEKFLSFTRIAMTVCYLKKDENKTKANLKREKEQKLSEFLNSVKDLKNIEKAALELIENPVLTYIPGEERIMVGRHYGIVNDLGRIEFLDMEVAKNTTLNYDNRMRQVDPRTLKYFVANKIKYELK